MRSTLIGLVAGLSIALPLFGSVAGVPSSGVAALVVAVALLLVLPSIVMNQLYSAILSPPMLAGAVFTFFVLLSAYESQWEFLVSPDLWRHNANRYFDAKLLMFVLTFGTGAATSMLVLVAKNKADMIKGVCLGVTVVSLMAVIRLAFVHGHQLWATDFALARMFFVTEKSLSTVSYGTLMMMGAICSLRFRWGWVISAVLLACAILIARRADAAITILATVGFFGFLCVNGKSFSPLTRLANFAVLATIVVFFGINGFSSAYFGNVLASAERRMDLLAASAKEGVHDRKKESISHSGSSGVTSGIGGARDNEAQAPLSGGLGYFSTGVIGKFKYPHNLFVEIYREVGVTGLVAVVTMLLTPLSIAFRRIRLSDANGILALLLMGSMVGISLKAGDISSTGRILFFSVLAYSVVKHGERSNEQERN